LRHQIALEGPLQYGLAQPRRTFQVCLHLGFDLIEYRKTPLDFRHYCFLLEEWRQWKD
jgi:hypothetical protein